MYEGFGGEGGEMEREGKEYNTERQREETCIREEKNVDRRGRRRRRRRISASFVNTTLSI